MEDGQPGPVFFAAAFAASAIAHIWQCLRYKSFKLIGLHPLCAVLLSCGYALREYGAFNFLYSDPNLIAFIMSQVFIYIYPPLLELANYHVLGRIFYYVPYLAPLPPGRVLATFGGLMAVVELLNSLGIALAANPTSSQGQQSTGKNLIIAALAIQLLVIIIFVALASVFHRRCRKANLRSLTITTPLATLYASMSLIFIRCLYRLVEHLGNTSVHLSDPESLKALSPILRYEWFFYLFEATLILVNSVLWNVWYPGRYLPMDYRVYLSRDGTLIQNQGGDNRSMAAKLAHILTFGLLFRNKSRNAEFVELSEQQAQRIET